MIYDTKIIIVIRDNLKEWQKLNVVGFLASSVAIKFPETHGRAFINATNCTYLPFIKNPIMVYVADSKQAIDRAFTRAKVRELPIGIYISELFATKGEEENLIEIAKYDDENQDLVGMVIYGENHKVNKAIDGLKLHP